MATPNIGVFIVDKIAVGAELNVYTESGYTSWAVGPFVRPYFAQSETRAFFAQGSFLAGGTSGNSKTSFGFGLGAGYSIFLNQSVALEIGSQYNKVGKNDDGIFGINIGFQIHFAK